MKVVMINKHLEKKLIELGIDRDRWSIIVNVALAERLKKEERWRREDNPENGYDDVIEWVRAIKSGIPLNNLPKQYFCLKCNCHHELTADLYLPHLIYKGEPSEKKKKYYEAVQEERLLHNRINTYRGLLSRAKKVGNEERIKYHQARIDALIPQWQKLRAKARMLKEECSE